jgi:Tat protein secretion system quality control protein TatD with DNase activity
VTPLLEGPLLAELRASDLRAKPTRAVGKHGKLLWRWVFICATATLFVVGKRSVEVVRQVLGETCHAWLMSDGPWAYQGEFEGLPSGPWLVSRVAEEIAKLKRLPVDDVMFRLSENTCRLFDLPWV